MDGHTYRGTVNLINRDTITLVGCFIGSVFCEAKTLHRTKAPQPLPPAMATSPKPRLRAVATSPLTSIWNTFNTRH